MSMSTFNPRTATAQECRELNAAATFAVGDRVRINDPGWWRHGEEGRVIKVNRVTIRVALDNGDRVTGGKVWFA